MCNGQSTCCRQPESAALPHIGSAGAGVLHSECFIAECTIFAWDLSRTLHDLARLARSIAANEHGLQVLYDNSRLIPNRRACDLACRHLSF